MLCVCVCVKAFTAVKTLPPFRYNQCRHTFACVKTHTHTHTHTIKNSASSLLIIYSNSRVKTHYHLILMRSPTDTFLKGSFL